MLYAVYFCVLYTVHCILRTVYCILCEGVLRTVHNVLDTVSAVPLGVTGVWAFSLYSLVVFSLFLFSLPQTPSRQAPKTRSPPRFLWRAKAKSKISWIASPNTNGLTGRSASSCATSDEVSPVARSRVCTYPGPKCARDPGIPGPRAHQRSKYSKVPGVDVHRVCSVPE